jgi:hypothetical protein
MIPILFSIEKTSWMERLYQMELQIKEGRIPFTEGSGWSKEVYPES